MCGIILLSRKMSKIWRVSASFQMTLSHFGGDDVPWRLSKTVSTKYARHWKPCTGFTKPNIPPNWQAVERDWISFDTNSQTAFRLATLFWSPKSTTSTFASWLTMRFDGTGTHWGYAQWLDIRCRGPPLGVHFDSACLQALNVSRCLLHTVYLSLLKLCGETFHSSLRTVSRKTSIWTWLEVFKTSLSLCCNQQSSDIKAFGGAFPPGSYMPRHDTHVPESLY